VISFNAAASQPATGRSLVTYVWDFGDNKVNDEHGSDASHAYFSAGTYTMVLGVVDDAGKVGSSIHTIVVTN
jgi:PKD repeat protein